jgi:hypothetical protein
VSEFPADGTVAEAKEWVEGGGDPQVAYEAETAGKGRVTLLEWLGERTGETDSAPAVPSSTEAADAKYVAKKRLVVDKKVYKPGDPVPGAEEWTRVEAWVRNGWITEA